MTIASSAANYGEFGSMSHELEALVGKFYECGILLPEAERCFKKRFIERVLRANRGNQVHAARELGMHRNTLSRTVVDLKIDVRAISGRKPESESLRRRRVDYGRLGAQVTNQKKPCPARQKHEALMASVRLLRRMPRRNKSLIPAFQASGLENPVRKGGRGESPEPSRGGNAAAHLAQAVPPRVEFDLECGGLTS